MKIREMKPEEIEVVRNLRLKGYAEYEAFVSSEHWSVLKGTLLADNDVTSNSKIFVAEIDGKIVGTIVLFPPSIKAYDWSESVVEHPEIRMLSIDPDFRGRGIAKSLVEHCLNVAREKNYESVGLHTASFMTNAQSLYKGMGFTRVPELDLEPMNDGIIVQAFTLKL